MSRTLAPESPRWRDDRNRRSAEAAKQSGPTDHFAAAAGVSPRAARAMRKTGDYGTFTAAFRYIDRACREPRMDPDIFPAALNERIEFNRIVTIDPATWVAAWLEACTEETEIQIALDPRQYALRSDLSCIESLTAIRLKAKVQAARSHRLGSLAAVRLLHLRN